MNKNPFSIVTLSSLLGLIISAIALALGTWYTRTIGPNQTAIDLWMSLQATISQAELLPNIDRQQEIFNWMSVIFSGFLAQTIMTIAIYYWRKLAGWMISAGLWMVTLSATAVLLFNYHALMNGVMLLAFGCVIALAGQLWGILMEITFQPRDHAEEIPNVERQWYDLLYEARKKDQCFSVLAIQSSLSLSFEQVQNLQTELRGRDKIYAVKNGVFVLLWQITPESTPFVANKLLSIIRGYTSHDVQIGLANYPEDSENLKALLSQAIQALESAKQSGGSGVISFNKPATRDKQDVLAPWEAQLVEAAHAQVPVSILGFLTPRPINLSEELLIKRELRGRDLVTVFENGFYVLLWNASADGGQVVLAKLEQLLAGVKIENQSRLAVSPQDGNTLAELLAAVDKK